MQTLKTTRVEQVMAHVRQLTGQRQMLPGARLPSIRQLAQTLGVSKSTIVDAYDRLVAEGLVMSRPGSGFYASGPVPPLSIARQGDDDFRDVDPVWMTRLSLADTPDMAKPGCGWLPSSWLPREDIARAMRSLARQPDSGLTDYATPLGLPALRQLIGHRLSQYQIPASPDHIMLCESGTQAIDLICRFLLEPGDTVLLDDPCYFNFHAMLRAHRVKSVTVPYTSTGPDEAAFARVVQLHKPRLYITNCAVHNPTGATLSPLVAHKVLKIAEAHDMLIVEDDVFADFEQTFAPRLAAFDGLDRVIHIGSFSKTLSASVRCGFVAARTDWIDSLVDLKLATSFGGGSLGAQLVHCLLKSGTYRRHVGAMRNRLTDARGQVGERLEAMGITPWTMPDAGMFLWCRLPDGLSAGEVARHALKEYLVLAPGEAFSVQEDGDNHGSAFLRFNVAQCLNPAMDAPLERAMRAAACASR